jgi:hypothetical protein
MPLERLTNHSFTAVAFLLAATTLLLGTIAMAHAQFSPGKLSRAHQDLEGSLNCTKCHSGEAEIMNDKCLTCHREIRRLEQDDAGLHASLSDRNCSKCHPEHAGRDFDLIYWDEGSPEKFNHQRAGWKLEGKHAEAECRACHKPEFQISPIMKLARTKYPEASWLGMPKDCQSCHEDPHKGNLGTDCTSCHSPAAWTETRQAGGFPHERTRYPLTGRHAQLECEQCHDPVKAWGKTPPFARCNSCHRDAHAGQATLAGARVDCASCHGTGGFRPSTYTVLKHAESRFPLGGKHRDVRCASCHPKNPATVPDSLLGSAKVHLRPPFNECLACHEPAHGDQLASRPDKGACESCHKVDGWIPSKFTIEDHAKLKFALDGRHAKTECASCHGPLRKDLPPLPDTTVTGRAGVLLAISDSSCRSCHLDPHGDGQKKFEDCLSCHTADSFHRTKVDVATHAAYSFPLKDSHGAVPCRDCHKELGQMPLTSTLIAAHVTPPNLSFNPPRERCEDCHENPHGQQFATAQTCEKCHDLKAFRPASGFDHNRDAAFSLKGAHEKVACDRCHSTRLDEAGREQVQYRPLDGTCLSCHRGGKG